MKTKIILFLSLLILLLIQSAKSQVLISLLLGDKLNSPNIEFGLEGGFNYTDFHNLDMGSRRPNFNLGFYFLFKLGEQSYFNTGVLVKENQGAEDLPTYPIGDPQIDNLFINGTMNRKINYFQVPFTYHFRTNAGIFLEAGLQLALKNGAKDFFMETIVDEDDIRFEIDRKSDYNTFDGGLLGGVGYKLKNKEGGAPGMSIGTKYYYGLVDITKDDTTELLNDSFYVYVRIPIGAGKAQAAGDSE